MRALVRAGIRAAIFTLVAGTAGCYTSFSPSSVRAMEDESVVRELVKPVAHEYYQSGPCNGGSAVYSSYRDLAFWVKDKTVYAVNERARAVAPSLKPAPDSVTYQAVYDASLPFPSYAEARISTTSMRGQDISPEEAADLEKAIKEHPEDLWARTVLLGRYDREKRSSPEVSQAYEGHVLWLIEHRPEAPILGSIEARLDSPARGGSAANTHKKAAELWKVQIEKHPKDARVLSNAAGFFQMGDSKLAMNLVDQCIALEPDNKEWRDQKAMFLSVPAMVASMSMGFLKPAPETSRKALEAKEEVFKMTKLPSARVSVAADLATLAFEAGDFDKARKYAGDALECAGLTGSMFKKDIVHKTNTVLGRLAMKDGDIAKAKEFLVASAAGQGVGESFGPSLTLAKELLDKGEKDAVIQFLESYAKDPDNPCYTQWIQAIKEGKKPDLSVINMMSSWHPKAS